MIPLAVWCVSRSVILRSLANLRWIRKTAPASHPSDWHRVQGGKRVYVVVRRASTEG